MQPIHTISPEALPTPSTRPRIAYLITNSEIGGAQAHVADLLRAMRGRAEVVLLAGGHGPLFDLADELGVSTIRLSAMDNALSPWKAIAALLELTRALRRIKPDLLHTHSAKASALGRIAARLAGLPVLYTVHGFAFKAAAPWNRRVLALIAECALAPLTSRVICVAKSEKNLALRLPIAKSRVSVIPNGISDVPQRSDPTAPFRRIATVMRLVAPKRPDVLIEAFAAANLPGCELVIAGDGPLRPALEQLAVRLAPGRILFAGNVSDIAGLLAGAEAFALASDHEGFPISVLEAMRAGLPVIASDLPGIREQLSDGQCGVLVQGGEPAPFAQAFRRIAHDVSLRRNLGQAARSRWEEYYGLDPMVSATWAVYRQTLSNCGRHDMQVTAL